MLLKTFQFLPIGLNPLQSKHTCFGKLEQRLPPLHNTKRKKDNIVGNMSPLRQINRAMFFQLNPVAPHKPAPTIGNVGCGLHNGHDPIHARVDNFPQQRKHGNRKDDKQIPNTELCSHAQTRLGRAGVALQQNQFHARVVEPNSLTLRLSAHTRPRAGVEEQFGTCQAAPKERAPENIQVGIGEQFLSQLLFCRPATSNSD